MERLKEIIREVEVEAGCVVTLARGTAFCKVFGDAERLQQFPIVGVTVRSSTVTKFWRKASAFWKRIGPLGPKVLRTVRLDHIRCYVV